MSLELRNRIVTTPGTGINVEGTSPDDPTRELAHGLEGVQVTVGKYLERQNRIILNERLSEKGTKEGILELGRETIEGGYRTRVMESLDQTPLRSQT